MKKLFVILGMLLPLLGCVGQKDDPEPEPIDPDPIVDPVDTEGMVSLVLDFTGTWCVNCPRMHTAIADAQAERPGRIIPVSVHCLAIDPLAPMPLSHELAERFGVTAYPSAVVDFEAESMFTATSSELLLSWCDKLLEERGPAAELVIESSVNEGAITATVSATVAQDGDYTLSLLLLEDGIIAAQTGGTEDYIHNDVLRSWHDAPSAFTALHSGDTISHTFTITLPSPEGTSFHLVALAFRSSTFSNAASHRI